MQRFDILEWKKKIELLMEKGELQLAIKEYALIILSVEKKEIDLNTDDKATLYFGYALLLFENMQYNSFINMISRALQYGYPKEEIEKILFEIFIEPNMEEFEKNYENNLKYLPENFKRKLDFKNLPYWLITNGEDGEYYLYNKKRHNFTGKVNLKNSIEVINFNPKDAFSDFLIIEDFNLEKIKSFHNEISKLDKKTYVVINDVPKFLSCLQVKIEYRDLFLKIKYFCDLGDMEDYFANNSEYLPKNVVDLSDSYNSTQNYLDNIHRKRINGKSDRKNILLSICIPTFNRGHRAYENVLHLLQSKHDEEFEIVVSNNGTLNETSKYYDKIENLGDSRIKYHKFNQNEGFMVNVCKVCELAEGKYILLISDEDLLDISKMDLLFQLLENNGSDLSVLKLSTNHQSRHRDKYGFAGEDAIRKFMLTSNYMSGIIYNNNLLKKHKFIDYIKNNPQNIACLTYPHSVWELLLAQYGDIKSTSTLYIQEGKAEEMENIYIEKLENIFDIPAFGTIDNRIEQHMGFMEVINEMEISKLEPHIRYIMYALLCHKTFFLVKLAIDLYYSKIPSSDIEDILETTYKCCIENISDDKNNEYYGIVSKSIDDCYVHYKQQLT